MALHTHMSICAGIGGLDLGLRLAVPGLRTVCYIEREAYAASVLVARMEDQALDQAPVWDDVATFDGRPWRGKVDLVSAGFPCQPWSCAGRRAGANDSRWIWPQIIRIIFAVKPGWVFLENVPGLLRGGMAHVVGDLAACGYCVTWDLVSARNCGAPHTRKRLFILGCASGDRGSEGGNREGTTNPLRVRVASTPVERQPIAPKAWTGRAGSSDAGSRMGYADIAGSQGRRVCGSERADELPPWPPGPQDTDAWRRVLEVEPGLEPAFCRVADGVPADMGEPRLRYRADQLRCLGNAVVPVVAAYAFRVLYRRLSGGDVA